MDVLMMDSRSIAVCAVRCLFVMVGVIAATNQRDGV